MSKSDDHFYSDDFIRRLRRLGEAQPIAARNLAIVERLAEEFREARKAYREFLELAFDLHIEQMEGTLRPCHQKKLKEKKLDLYIYDP